MTRQDIVLDASVGLELVLRQALSAGLRSMAAEWIRDGLRLAVPAQFWLEVVNSLSNRHRWRSETMFEAIRELDELGIVTVDLDRPQLLLVVDRAERYGLTAYDAAYLVLAEHLDANLATLDRDLGRAAGDRAISLRPGHKVSDATSPYGRVFEGQDRVISWPNYSGVSAFMAKLRAEARRELEAHGR